MHTKVIEPCVVCEPCVAFGVAGFTVDGIARFCCIFRCLPPFFVADFTLTYNLS